MDCLNLIKVRSFLKILPECTWVLGSEILELLMNVTSCLPFLLAGEGLQLLSQCPELLPDNICVGGFLQIFASFLYFPLQLFALAVKPGIS